MTSGTRRRARFVLFVEDCPDVRALCVPALVAAGFIVNEVPTLDQALAFIENFEPDAVILDRELPDGDGFDVARALRSRGSSTRILAHTAHAGAEVRAAAQAAGCHAFLPKPVAADRLVRAVRVMLATSELVQCG